MHWTISLISQKAAHFLDPGTGRGCSAGVINHAERGQNILINHFPRTFKCSWIPLIGSPICTFFLVFNVWSCYLWNNTFYYKNTKKKDFSFPFCLVYKDIQQATNPSQRCCSTQRPWIQFWAAVPSLNRHERKPMKPSFVWIWHFHQQCSFALKQKAVVGERVVPIFFVSIFKCWIVSSMGNEDTWRKKPRTPPSLTHWNSFSVGLRSFWLCSHRMVWVGRNIKDLAV